MLLYSLYSRLQEQLPASGASSGVSGRVRCDVDCAMGFHNMVCGQADWPGQ